MVVLQHYRTPAPHRISIPYTRSLFFTPNAYSVQEKPLSCTEFLKPIHVARLAVAEKNCPPNCWQSLRGWNMLGGRRVLGGHVEQSASALNLASALKRVAVASERPVRPRTGQGEGSARDKFRVSGTKEMVEGAGANKVSGVLSEASCIRCGTLNFTKKEADHLSTSLNCGAGEGTRTHTRKAPDPKSGLSTNFNTPATRVAKVRKLADNANSAVAFCTAPKETGLLQRWQHYSNGNCTALKAAALLQR